MRATYLIAFALTLTTATDIHGAQLQCYNGVCWMAEPDDYRILPPAAFDYDFPGVIIEKTATSKDDMAQWCAPNPKASIAMGCSTWALRMPNSHKTCWIYYAPDWYLQKYKVSQDAVRRHEIAHCNGWPGDHPPGGGVTDALPYWRPFATDGRWR